MTRVLRPLCRTGLLGIQTTRLPICISPRLALIHTPSSSVDKTQLKKKYGFGRYARSPYIPVLMLLGFLSSALISLMTQKHEYQDVVIKGETRISMLKALIKKLESDEVVDLDAELKILSDSEDRSLDQLFEEIQRADEEWIEHREAELDAAEEELTRNQAEAISAVPTLLENRADNSPENSTDSSSENSSDFIPPPSRSSAKFL